ncbi:Signal recognition particle SEC65 subunit [Astathelohania contejeani]|uniref:Signal recognition particle SEC65 subunit n=1 Tax=Astathelohania contejeani TaxID=164912 RepID=A0ABQ7HXV1_9MICR|nr:Signal recognition particle SEC65 subunit [Thelohania contejeani]
MEENYFYLYPIFLDSTRKRAQGRKYPLGQCIPNPTFNEINTAIVHLNIECVAEPAKRHPREPLVWGRFKIKKMYDKQYIINGICHTITEVRNKKSEETKITVNKSGDKKGYIKNPLNLIPKKKKKGRNKK